MKHLKIVPIITLFIGLGVASFMFYNVAISPLLNPTRIEMNDTYTINVSKQYIVTIFIDENNIEDLTIEDFTNFKKLSYTKLEIEYSVLLNVLTDDQSNEGYEITATDEVSSYNIQSLNGVFQIHFNEPGIYYFGLITYDDEGTEFYMVTTNVEKAKTELYASITIGSISFLGSLLSLYFVLKNPKKG